MKRVFYHRCNRLQALIWAAYAVHPAQKCFTRGARADLPSGKMQHPLWALGSTNSLGCSEESSFVLTTTCSRARLATHAWCWSSGQNILHRDLTHTTARKSTVCMVTEGTLQYLTRRAGPSNHTWDQNIPVNNTYLQAWVHTGKPHFSKKLLDIAHSRKYLIICIWTNMTSRLGTAKGCFL